MFSIISIVRFWKYRELLLYCTLDENIVRKIHLLKKPAAGAARIRKCEKKLITPPLDKGGLDPRRGGGYYVTVGKWLRRNHGFFLLFVNKHIISLKNKNEIPN